MPGATEPPKAASGTTPAREEPRRASGMRHLDIIARAAAALGIAWISVAVLTGGMITVPKPEPS